MSEIKTGNIEAIRDWTKRYFYTKSDVSEFFTKLNTGLTAYKLTLVGPANTDIHIAEDYQTDTQEYDIKLLSNGTYSGLFFFHADSTLNIAGDDAYSVWPLTKYIDIIYLSDPPIQLLASHWSSTSNDLSTSVTVNGCSDYDYLLVIGDVSARNSQSEETMRNTMHIDVGDEISYCGGISTAGGSSLLVTVNKVPVTEDTMVITGNIYSYQVFGVKDLNVREITKLFDTNGSSITEIPINNYEDCVYLLPILVYRNQNGINEASMRNNVYYTGKTEIGYDGGYINSSSSSRIVLTYLALLSDVNSNRLVNLKTSEYIVLGLY